MKTKHFKPDAKSIVDTLFDAKCFRDDVTRDDMNATEELIEYCMSSRFESYVKMKELTDRFNKLKK